jgi:hypothetical protein
MVRILIATLAGLVFALPCFAQDPTRIQGKVVARAPIPTEPGWYPAAWSITNIRQEAPDNTNLMIGIGRKMTNGWVEVMAQRQYSLHASQWFVDFRLQRQLPLKLGMFVEVAPFLETKALFTFVRIDKPLIGRFNLVMESENIHREGIDSWGVGPGFSLKPMQVLGRLRFAPVVVWQIRPNDPDFIRFYFGFPL